MTTNDLIERLASELKPVSRKAVLRRIGIGLGISSVASAILMWSWLGMRPDLMTAAGTMAFWVKFTYTLALAVGGAWAVKRIAYPLGSIRISLAVMAGALALICMLAFAQLAMSPSTSWCCRCRCCSAPSGCCAAWRRRGPRLPGSRPALRRGRLQRLSTLSTAMKAPCRSSPSGTRSG